MNIKFQDSNVKGMSKFKYQIQFKMPKVGLIQDMSFLLQKVKRQEGHLKSLLRNLRRNDGY